MVCNLMGPIFQCTQCGDCCKGYGGTVISDKDARAIAEYLNMPLDRFIQTHCTYSGKQLMLAQKASGYCTFWDTLCNIHPVKPKMCKAWPFIKSVLIDNDNWRIMAGSCPGMSANAPDEQIRTETLEAIKRQE